jgi:hypothetical protein
MGKMTKTINDTLPEFQKYLLEKNLVPAKNTPFFAHWVSRFLNYARRNDLSTVEYQETAVLEFLEFLKADKHILDWQHKQANDSLRLYFFHYLGKTDSRTAKVIDSQNIAEIIEETKRLIRLKHYAYSTERTYIQWTERFLEYIVQTIKKKISDVDSSDFKNFISHLALKKRVSASTQNQAFNAILFFFRYALGKDAGNISDTVRAKRGQKLPVVFSVAEVKRLLDCLTGRDLLIAGLIYGAGLRLMELARLRVKDVDMDLNTLTISSSRSSPRREWGAARGSGWPRCTGSSGVTRESLPFTAKRGMAPVSISTCRPRTRQPKSGLPARRPRTSKGMKRSFWPRMNPSSPRSPPRC